MWYIWQSLKKFSVSDNGFIKGNLFHDQEMEVPVLERFLPILRFIYTQYKCLQSDVYIFFLMDIHNQL